MATTADIDRVVDKAAALAPEFGRDYDRRVEFLNRIARYLLEDKEKLFELANSETALPMARLEGELTRTVKQLRMFAEVVRKGEFLDTVIDAGSTDLRRMMLPLGPVAVFGASNFPFAYSVAGGDTASALAAGCPVIVKAHPAHPQTSDATCTAVLRAAQDCRLPDGVFSMVVGTADVGRDLCLHPKLEAVGFTGSLRGGRALFDLAASRPRPIPVFAEMGSVNPVFVLPDAGHNRGQKIAEGYAASLTLGVGQFCTNPGLLVGIGQEFQTLIDWVGMNVSTNEGVMLTPSIRDAYLSGSKARAALLHVPELENKVVPHLFTATAEQFLAEPELQEELFGPSAVAITCTSWEEMLQVANRLQGQLTASVHAEESEYDQARELLALLEQKAGRLVFNGYPTGVEVSPAMQHGGPYPATTDTRFTSVGPGAIRRFLRPVAYQSFPQSLLPPPLQSV
jgi:NADP-dependent aldehyde dehydrogenase